MSRVTAFHGTSASFENFEMKETGIWFISDKTEAEEYGSIIKRVELDITNALYIPHELKAYKGDQYITSKRKTHTIIILPSDAAFADQHVYTEAYYDVYIVFDTARIKNLACIF